MNLTFLIWSGIASAQGTASPPSSSVEVEGSAEVEVEDSTEGTAAEQPTPAAPVIVRPQLVYFHDAAYPPQALAAGLEADVVLKLVVGVDGSVQSAEVVEPVGNGFDEAAVAAAQQFVFTPAQRDGQPIAVAIEYVYRFTAPEVETVVQDAAPPTTGNLEGQVLIAGAEVPLAGATIRIDAAGAPAEGAQAPTPPLEVGADADGRWALPELPPGDYRVTISAPGFSPIESVETVVVGEATELTFRLSEASEGIEVIVQGERPPREVTRRTLQRREISKVPGTGGDALRSIQSLPGVARPPGLAGLLIVRGSGPQDTNTYIDGALVPIIYHFGGLSSVVPTELLDKIDFYPGNFGTRYGRVMGGIVDVGLRSPDTECTDSKGNLTGESDCYHGLAQVDLIDARALLQGPITDDWSFALAGRRSWVDAWLKPVLEEAGAGVTTAPVYFDYQAIVEHKPSPTQKFKVQAYGSDDALEIIINNPSAQEPGFGGQLGFSTAFYRLQAIYEQQLSNDWNLYSTVAVGRDVLRLGLGSVKFSIDAKPIEARSELSWNAFPGLKINGGLDFLVVPVDVQVRLPEPPRDGEADPGPFTLRRILESNTKTTVFRPAWYADAEIQPSERLLLVPGFRVDYARDTGHADFDPRISGRYTLFGADSDAGADGQTPRKTTLKGGVGVYSQAPQFQETDKVFGTPGIESNRSTHLSLGLEQELTDQIEVSVEGYYKFLYNLVSRTPSLAGGFVYNNEGDGAVVGLETLVRYNADERFFGWLAYTLSRSTRRDGPDLDEYLFQFDQTHILTALGSYRLGGGWEIGGRYRLVSGNMTTPVRSYPDLPALFAADAGAYAPLQGEPFSKRLPLVHQLDIRLERTWRFQDWRLLAYLDVWNAYNNAVIEATTYNFNYSRRAPQSGLPIIPSLGIRGEF